VDLRHHARVPKALSRFAKYDLPSVHSQRLSSDHASMVRCRVQECRFPVISKSQKRGKGVNVQIY
jgi:hypothetical protein